MEICFFFPLSNFSDFRSILEPPIQQDWLKDVDVRVQFGLKFGKERQFLKTGDAVIIVTGWKQGSGFTNTMRTVYVSN